jgi:WD40 repeat protein
MYRLQKSPGKGLMRMVNKTVVWLDCVDSFFLNMVIQHDVTLSALTFSPDSTKIAIADHNGTVEILSTTTGQKVSAFSCPYHKKHKAHLLSFSNDGSSIAAAFPIKAGVWDVESASVRDLQFNLFGALPKVQAFRPDLRTLISSISTNRIYRVDLMSGEESNILPPGAKELQSNSPSVDEPNIVASLSPSGTILASVGFFGKRITLTDLANMKVIAKFDYPYGCIEQLHFSKDSKKLVSLCSNSGVMIWDTKTGQELKDYYDFFAGNCLKVHSVALDHSSSIIAFGVENCDGENSINVWSVNERESMMSFKCEHKLSSLQFSPDGRFLASSEENGSVKLWESRDWKYLQWEPYEASNKLYLVLSGANRKTVFRSEKQTLRFDPPVNAEF